MHLYRWYAVYTHINEEQQMLDYLQKRGLKVYMPLRRHTAMVGKEKNQLRAAVSIAPFCEDDGRGLKAGKTGVELLPHGASRQISGGDF